MTHAIQISISCMQFSLYTAVQLMGNAYLWFGCYVLQWMRDFASSGNSRRNTNYSVFGTLKAKKLLFWLAARKFSVSADVQDATLIEHSRDGQWPGLMLTPWKLVMTKRENRESERNWDRERCRDKWIETQADSHERWGEKGCYYNINAKSNVNQLKGNFPSIKLPTKHWPMRTAYWREHQISQQLFQMKTMKP